MKTYTVLYAEDVPHYGTVDIDAKSDQAAIAIAKGRDDISDITTDPAHNDTVSQRIVHIQDPDGNIIAQDIALDTYALMVGDHSLFAAAEEMLSILQFAVETEEGNWEGLDDEPQWLQQARTVIAKARGKK